MPPSVAADDSTHARAPSGSLRSTSLPWTSNPSARSSCAVASAAPGCTSQPATRAPCSAKRRWAAAPCPPAVPVRSTRLPASRPEATPSDGKVARIRSDDAAGHDRGEVARQKERDAADLVLGGDPPERQPPAV